MFGVDSRLVKTCPNLARYQQQTFTNKLYMYYWTIVYCGELLCIEEK